MFVLLICIAIVCTVRSNPGACAGGKIN